MVEACPPWSYTGHMRILEFSHERARPIQLFATSGASNVHLASGRGEVHAYCQYFEPGGTIGTHPAGYAQLFVVVEGEGWVAGVDGTHVPIVTGQAAFFDPGEIHSKGSGKGMTAITVQADELGAPD
jgi:hypothetical protein